MVVALLVTAAKDWTLLSPQLAGLAVGVPAVDVGVPAVDVGVPAVGRLVHVSRQSALH